MLLGGSYRTTGQASRLGGSTRLGIVRIAPDPSVLAV